MKRTIALWALFCLAAISGLAEPAISVETLQKGENRRALFHGEAFEAQLEERFQQENARAVFARAREDAQLIDIREEAFLWEDERLASMALLREGELADRRYGSEAISLALDLATGEELPLGAFFTDEAAALTAAEAIIEERIEGSLSDYTEVAELLPVPTDCFQLDDYGVTLWYPEERYRLFDGRCGAVHLAWFELDAAAGQPIAALFDPQEASAEAVAEAVCNGCFSQEARLLLGKTLGEISAEIRLSDPDYTDESLLYSSEDARLRGWSVEIPKYALTAEEETPIHAIRCARIAFFGLETGRTTRQEIVHLLGEPLEAKPYDERTADDRMLCAGESLFYAFGAHVLEAHLDEAGVLACLILADALPGSV